MYRLLIAGLLALLPGTASAQAGCTDPSATNYDPTAQSNNGSCVYAYLHVAPQKKCSIDSAVMETSGLVYSDGRLWTHNDGGNTAAFYSIDTSTGAILQTVHIDNYPNTDWEDMAADSTYFYLADCGNNNGDRQNLKILKIAKSDISTGPIVHLNAQAIQLSYADQSSYASNPYTNYDCEAMVAVGDSLYLFSKNRGDNATRVYRVAKTPGNYAVAPYTSYNVGGLITGASYNPQRREVVLIGYSLLGTNAFIWLLYDYKGDQFFSGNKRRIDINNGGNWQTEAIAWMPGQRLFLSCENFGGTPANLYQMSRVLPATTSIAEPAQQQESLLFPNPASNHIQVRTAAAASYQIYNGNGQVVQEGRLQKGNNTIGIHMLASGSYTLQSRRKAKALPFVKK